MPIRPDNPFYWGDDEADIILTYIRWYLDLPLDRYAKRNEDFVLVSKAVRQL
jgi:hypothetical protein